MKLSFIDILKFIVKGFNVVETGNVIKLHKHLFYVLVKIFCSIICLYVFMNSSVLNNLLKSKIKPTGRKIAYQVTEVFINN